MSDHLKLLTKNYGRRHPVKALSAARLEYSMLLMPDAMELVDENLPKLRAMGADIPDTAELMEKVGQEENIGVPLKTPYGILRKQRCCLLYRGL